MKRYSIYLTVCLFIAVVLQFIVPPFLFDGPAWNGRLQEGTAVFPNELVHVGNEAFEGTSFHTLVFQEDLLRVDDRAFSGMESLREAYFPRSTEYIADSAFSLSSLERLYGFEDSYVQEWAERHGMEFKQNDWASAPSNVRVAVEILLPLFGTVCIPVDDNRKKIKRYIKMLVISMRPQDRPELHPIDYRFP